MKASSQDVRERVLRAVDRGCPRTEIVQLFGVSRASIKQRREEGHVRPKAIPGRSPKKRAQVEESVLPQLQANADASASATLWYVGTDVRCTREPIDNESCHQTVGLDAKKKSLEATERKEEARAA